MGLNEELKQIETKISPYLKLGYIAIAAVILGVLGIILLPGMISAFPAIIGNLGIGIGAWWVIDKYALTDINTIDEIKKNNTSFGLMMIAFAIILAAAIIGS